jgi:hypothetical protein
VAQVVRLSPPTHPPSPLSPVCCRPTTHVLVCGASGCVLCGAGIADTAPKRCGLLTDLVAAAAVASGYPPTDNLGAVDEGELRDILTAMKKAPGGLNALWDIMNLNFGGLATGGLPGINVLPKVRGCGWEGVWRLGGSVDGRLLCLTTAHAPPFLSCTPPPTPPRTSCALDAGCPSLACYLLGGQIERQRVMAELMRVLDTTYVSEDGGPVAPPPNNPAYIAGLFTVLKAANAVVVKPKDPPADGAATSTEDFGGGSGREKTGAVDGGSWPSALAVGGAATGGGWCHFSLSSPPPHPPPPTPHPTAPRWSAGLASLGSNLPIQLCLSIPLYSSPAHLACLGVPVDPPPLPRLFPSRRGIVPSWWWLPRVWQLCWRLSGRWRRCRL